MYSQQSAHDGSADNQKRRVVCVFCGSAAGTTPVHLEAARELAKALHENSCKLVYGGGTVGIMGEVARTLVALSGPQSVHGIIPQALVKYEQNWDPEQPQDINKAIDSSLFGQTTVVRDMHSRKKMMAEEVVNGAAGSGFVALSGGYGTMEELMEVTTWNQLGIHSRGIVVFNVDGYWDGLIQWVRNAVVHGFISTANSDILVEAKTAAAVLRALKEYKISEDRHKLEWTSEG